MKGSFLKTLRWSAIVLATGMFGIPTYQAQGAIYWPGGGTGGDKDTQFQEGWDDGQEDCRTTPQECGVKLGDMIKDQGYGETEPNDHLFNADGLLLGQFYHANSLDDQDEDWYYVIADKKNQKLTVHFLGDPGNYTDTKGWVIRIRDLKGNVIAAFDSEAKIGAGVEGAPAEGGAQSPVQQAKLTEVALGKAGTYYISVKPKGEDGQNRGYNIGATLDDTGQVTAIEDENRFDTETEPNDDKTHADTLRSNVAMVGVFDRTLQKNILITTPAKTEYKYFYQGCDETNPATLPPGKQDCACDITKDPLDSPNITMPPPGGFPNPIPNDYCATNPGVDACDRVAACEARAFTTPEKTEWRGLFDYDEDVFVYHSEGDEQLRIQICTRTVCEFTKVHLHVSKGDTGIVLMDGPIEPGQVIDLGVALAGDYYFVFSPEETGVDSETGDAKVEELVGPYDFLLMSTRFKPGGTIKTTSKPQPVKPKKKTNDDNNETQSNDRDSDNKEFSWRDLLGD